MGHSFWEIQIVYRCNNKMDKNSEKLVCAEVRDRTVNANKDWISRLEGPVWGCYRRLPIITRQNLHFAALYAPSPALGLGCF